MTPLTAGQRIILDPERPAELWRVVRVTPCSATIARLYSTPRQVTLVDRHGQERTFLATVGERITISACAHVARA